MADLSAVLRKTIDGLPNATPQLRAKVYEKARAAIERQIAGASPPLPDDVVEARRSALADAIDRTEDHYLEQDLSLAGIDAPAEPERTTAPAIPPLPPRIDPQTVRTGAPASMPNVDKGPQGTSAGLQKPAWPKAAAPVAGGTPAARGELRRDPAAPSDRMAPQVAPGGAGPQRSSEQSRPPFVSDQAKGKAPGKPGAIPADQRREPQTKGLFPFPTNAETEPSGGLDTSSIPAADVAGPRYSNGRRQGKQSRAPVLAGLLVLLLLGGGGALAYVYQDQLVALVNGETSTTTAATTPPSATRQEPAGEEEGGVEEGEESQVAALPSGVEAPAAAPPSAETTAPAAAPPTTNGANGTAKRRFTQRLLPDGSEVDQGPGAANANAFDEGTNIAAASPDAPAAVTLPPTVAPTAATPEVPPTETVTQPPATPATPPTETAALQPDSVAGVPAVAQKLVFYEERTETEQGTQRGGSVVWSVVNESPAEGQPPEPAIRAVADIPEENLKLTMTIRRNADVTLPASHVIELMFDVPPAFTGGQIANVQRLALKPTEEARGEPLIGVAGKISDGFFIIALNNLDQATQSNLALMGKEQWIDIPLAYATGRRALISIEKGIPGDRVFKQAMDAWAAKT